MRQPTGPAASVAIAANVSTAVPATSALRHEFMCVPLPVQERFVDETYGGNLCVRRQARVRSGAVGWVSAVFGA